jgi:hypothetical protein
VSGELTFCGFVSSIFAPVYLIGNWIGMALINNHALCCKAL